MFNKITEIISTGEAYKAARRTQNPFDDINAGFNLAKGIFDIALGAASVISNAKTAINNNENIYDVGTVINDYAFPETKLNSGQESLQI